MLIIKYRVHAIGAILRIESVKARGTTVTCCVPGKRRQAEDVVSSVAETSFEIQFDSKSIISRL